jgi:F-type H+-transporting ATPase subunit d
MAGRRISKSLVDWAAFAERVPPNQRDAFRAFKTKSDMFVSKVHRFPEKLAPIDFAHYQSKLANPAMVAEFEKQYKTLTIPYPVDKDNVKSKIGQEEQAAKASTDQQIADAKKVISDCKAILTKIDSVPNPDVMTNEMYVDYFPAQALDPEKRPTFWPHTKSYQPDKHTIT